MHMVTGTLKRRHRKLETILGRQNTIKLHIQFLNSFIQHLLISKQLIFIGHCEKNQ